LPEEEAKRINWLKDFLPKKFPAARVIAIGHNANWFFNAPVKTAYEAATNILRAIKESRKLNKV
jgi:lysophospholipase L1-like esterase